MANKQFKDLAAKATLDGTELVPFQEAAGGAGSTKHFVIGTAAQKNVPASGNAGAGEVVKGDDTRLTDERTPTDNSATNAKLADMTASTLKGRVTAGTGDPEDLTAAQVRTLINVEDGATADQTAAEIKTAYESNVDTNPFTDAEKTKLTGIEALADVTDAANVAAAGAAMAANNLSDLASAATARSNLAVAPSAVEINAQIGATYTLVLADQSTLITLDNAGAITLTVPDNATAAFPAGSVIALQQQGAGQVTVAAAVGVTINSEGGKLKLSAQWVGATLTKTATDTWWLAGSLAA